MKKLELIGSPVTLGMVLAQICLRATPLTLLKASVMQATGDGRQTFTDSVERELDISRWEEELTEFLSGLADPPLTIISLTYRSWPTMFHVSITVLPDLL